MINIGILNLQGAVSEHLNITKKAIKNLKMENEIKVESVRYANEVAKCDGIIISGGESTVIGKLIHERKIDKVIKENNIPVFGTCAGMVILSKKTDYDQDILEIMDIKVKRNAFGRQKDSFEKEISICDKNFQGVFIRAPAVEEVFNVENNELGCVKILSELDSKIIAVQQGKNIAMAFHPELTEDTSLHEYFLKILLDLKE